MFKNQEASIDNHQHAFLNFEEYNDLKDEPRQIDCPGLVSTQLHLPAEVQSAYGVKLFSFLLNLWAPPYRGN